MRTAVTDPTRHLTPADRAWLTRHGWSPRPDWAPVAPPEPAGPAYPGLTAVAGWAGVLGLAVAVNGPYPVALAAVGAVVGLGAWAARRMTGRSDR